MRSDPARSGYMFLGIAIVPVVGTMVLGALNLKGHWTLAPLAGFLGVLVLMVVAGWRALRAMAKRDAWGRQGRCAGCGYDLAGLAREESCPECGEKRAA